MRINPQDTLVGQPILKIRAFLRAYQLSNWGEEAIKTALNVDLRTTRKLIDTLKKRGYIKSFDVSGRKYWKTTLKGNALALASAAKPISRATAERKLGEFLQRVTEVRKSKYYLYKVSEVVVFGSYLSKKVKINDVDISISLVPKEIDEQRRRNLAEERIDNAIFCGKVFRNLGEQILWPQLEVIRFLKGRSRSIGLHVDEPVIERCRHKVIYRDKTK